MQQFPKKSGKFFREGKSLNTFPKFLYICIRIRSRFGNLSIIAVGEQFPCYRAPRVSSIITMTSKMSYEFIFTVNQRDWNGSYVLHIFFSKVPSKKSIDVPTFSILIQKL